jgi:hypothetical protein
MVNDKYNLLYRKWGMGWYERSLRISARYSNANEYIYTYVYRNWWHSLSKRYSTGKPPASS